MSHLKIVGNSKPFGKIDLDVSATKDNTGKDQAVSVGRKKIANRCELMEQLRKISEDIGDIYRKIADD